MTRWQAVSGWFKISREKRSIDVCLFYYIYWLYYLQINKAAWLASALVGNVQDLGSSPRSSPLSIYFSINVRMQFQHGGPLYAFKIKPSTRMPGPIKGSRLQDYDERQPTPHTLVEKSARPWIIGLKLLGFHLTIGGRPPLGLQIFLLSLFFIIFTFF